jgi:hypothetical protein
MVRIPQRSQGRDKKKAKAAPKKAAKVAAPKKKA